MVFVKRTREQVLYPKIVPPSTHLEIAPRTSTLSLADDDLPLPHSEINSSRDGAKDLQSLVNLTSVKSNNAFRSNYTHDGQFIKL
ncbi:hypothetical protein V6N11_037886 [Hibiscus sabdariffa]|uniref:Uncharacterized protein n=2 Tax=Hibiscus sabdariffa TaxID=183260 RepID=A0ABR1ZJ96_9ROSI